MRVIFRILRRQHVALHYKKTDYDGFRGGSEYDSGWEDETDMSGTGQDGKPVSPQIRCHIMLTCLSRIRYNQ
jgi:hypothetical protein